MTLRLGDTLIAGSGANQDLSNLTSQGKNIANWSSNVTNCITEIPQDIKLELSSGTLTFKAGSKVYDGNSNSFSITSDITKSGLTGGDVQQFLLLKTDGSTLLSVGVSDTSFAYNSSTGYVHSNVYGDYYLPIALTSHNTGTGEYTSIDQVFNGFSYIGSTLFALPNVKGLIPNGRNADGTLKSTPYIINSVITRTWTNQSAEGMLVVDALTTGDNHLAIRPSAYYDEYSNNLVNVGVINEADVGYVKLESGKITSFIPKTAFHALDYNDSSTISGWGMPSSRYIDLTLLASGSTYTAPANGCFAVSKIAGQRFYYVSMYYTTGELEDFREAYETSPCTCSLSVRKGQVIKIDYNATGTTNFFRFTYAEGEN